MLSRDRGVRDNFGDMDMEGAMSRDWVRAWGASGARSPAG
jgi:hypothetical protein